MAVNRYEEVHRFARHLRETLPARDRALGAGTFGEEVVRLLWRGDDDTPNSQATAALLVARVLARRLTGQPDHLGALQEMRNRHYDAATLLYLCGRRCGLARKPQAELERQTPGEVANGIG